MPFRLKALLLVLALLASSMPAQAHRLQRPAVRQQEQVRLASRQDRQSARFRPLPRFKGGARARSTLRSLGQGLIQRCRGVCTAGKQLRQRTTQRLHRLSRALVERGRRVRKSGGKLLRGAATAARQAGRWARKHPGKAVGLGLGTAAMFGTVFYVAPLLSGGISSCLAPVLGKTAAGVLGTAAGGALACGSRSLLVHSTPMLLKVDPFNARQLSTDVAMSSTFGFFGFAQAAAMKSMTGSLGVSGLGLFAANYVGLVGYELFKDYLQNRIRNRVANDPKSFREIWKSSLMMETASNLHRCIPGLGLETNFGAKIVGDLGGTIWWDRIVNKRNKPGQQPGHVHDALTE